MFINLWILFGSFGIIFSILLFIWAVKKGQFEDQERARFLPLKDIDDDDKLKKPRRGFSETMLFMIIAVLGLAMISIMIVLSFVK